MLKSFILSGFLAFLCALPGTVHAAAQVGEPAPTFTATTASGETINLEDFRGQRVVLEWTNHQCPYVIKHYDTGNMQAAQKKVTEGGDVWLTIVSSAPGKQGHTTAEEALAIEAEAGTASTARILDSSGEIGQLYKAEVTPHMFVIDEEGVLVYQGAIDSDSSARHSTVEGATNYVLAALDSLEAGEQPDPAVTQPYGCSVKYDY